MKQNYDEILKRLSTIMHRLNLGEVLTVSKLASDLDVHTRTIQRDLNSILKNCFPIKQDKKNWKMDDNYHMSNAQIDNIIQYHMIEKLVKDSGEKFYDKSKEILQLIKNKIFDIQTDDKKNKLPPCISQCIIDLFEKASCDYKTHNIVTIKHVGDFENYIGGYSAGKYVIFSKMGILYEYDTLDDFYAHGWIIE